MVSLLSLVLATAFSSGKAAQAVDPKTYAGLVWRNVGPFRGGRLSAVTGAVGQPGVFYVGAPRGGVWKSTNAGITWEQIFDDVKDASGVGSVEVAPSDPNIVYVGLGDGTTGGGHDEGNGVYKSTDAGKTWTHVGLDKAFQIQSLLIDPKDPNLVLAAVLGEARKPGPDRGIYRTTDGGKTWTKVLYTDDSTGGQKLSAAYDNPDVIFATTIRHAGSFGFGAAASDPKIKGTAIFKSIDHGLTWKEVKGKGLPERLNGRTSISVANHTNSQRVYFVSGAGLWRTDDGGDNWKQMDKEDGRVRNGQGGYNCGVYANSANPDIVYVINTSSYVSRDGGNTFTGYKGAPGGDDPQQMWVDPTNGDRMAFAVDQGPTVTLDGGKTWSGWYNIPNGQFYHMSVSQNWPYWLFASMQDSGAIAMASRGNYGEITPLDWSPNSGWEWGPICVDPLDVRTVYSAGQNNDIIKQFTPTGQYVTVGPDINAKLGLRHDFNQPIVFSPINKHELLIGYQFLFSSTDGGKSFHQLGQDLTQPAGYVEPKPAPKKPEPKKADTAKPKQNEPDEDEQNDPKDAFEHNMEMGDDAQRRGGFAAICSLSPSSIDNGIIWAGINNGTVKLTKDHGKTWLDANIPGVKGSITSIDASHTDPASAYVAIAQQNENVPSVYRTKNFGKSWTKIVNGLPEGEVTGSWTNIIKADTKKDGLLFLGTESSMYVSFNDGDSWQSLRLNLPNTSYRDIDVHGNDLVVATYGRSFWILDDISPLRQVQSNLGSSFLFAPGDAIRVRRNTNGDTPFPPETAHALNAPPGALVYYFLGSKPSQPITLDVFDDKGVEVRHYSSEPIPFPDPKPPHPDFWVEVPKPLPTEIGTNRINWDLRFDPPSVSFHSYDINANPYLTPASPLGPLVAPGKYKLVLTVDGKSSTQYVTVTNDPRSPASLSDVMAEAKAQADLYRANQLSVRENKAVSSLRDAVNSLLQTKPAEDIKKAASDLSDKLGHLAAAAGPRRFGPGGPGADAAGPTFGGVASEAIRFLGSMEMGDMRPNEPLSAAIKSTLSDFETLEKALAEIRKKDLPALNAKLSKAGLKPIAEPSANMDAAKRD